MGLIKKIRKYFSIGDYPPERQRTLAAFYIGIVFSGSAHVFYLGLYGWAGPASLFYFNIVSVITFAIALFLVQKQKLTWAIILIFLEVDLHSVAGTVIFGWDYYFQLNILPLSMGMYLLPPGNKALKIAGPIFNYSLFIALWQYMERQGPLGAETQFDLKPILENFNLFGVFAMTNLLGFYYYFTARRSEEALKEQIETVRAMNLEAELDLRMAAHVQESLFPQRPPSVKDWDLAFAFKPMSGVSGDLYDFYVSDGNLNGLALFDVSGHGISSGLITMIARSCFHRNFRKGNGKNLSSIIEEANRDLISEMGNVDNYLTGILLRCNEDQIDYVNAGHCDLLYKSAKSGSVREVKPPDQEIRGHLLGLAAFDGEYKSFAFRLNTSDTLMLYSDCLLESTNADGEMYGQERLKEAFRKSPDLDAEGILNYVLEDFYNFIGNSPLGDDLTAVIAKRKSESVEVLLN